VNPAAEHLVVGAGISGLHAALLLARAGRRVRVLERAARAGGLAGAELFRGVPCDLGSHRLHPEALERPLFREIHRAEPFLSRPRRGVLLFNGRRLPYPPSAFAMLRALGPAASLSLALSLTARAAQRRALARWDDDRTSALGGDVGFERFVCARVGERAYHAFYRPYAEKVWGIDPADLSQTVAKKRVSTTHPWRLARSAAGSVARRLAGHREDRLEGFVYPRRGIASIIGWLEAELAGLGVPIERGRAFRLDEPRGGPALFAGDLRDLVPTTLEHRGLYLVYLALPGARIASEETYYAPEPAFWFGRVSVPERYSPALRREGETILTVEIPEGRWGPGVDFSCGERLEALLAQLARAGIAAPGARPIEVRQRFVPGVYPLYRRGWIEAWRAAMRAVAALGEVLPFGRQGLFLHCNLDHCADIAADAVAHVEAGGSAAGWVEKAERYVELRVRD
jgi:hypothetical protein